jgi:hypothetical protein
MILETWTLKCSRDFTEEPSSSTQGREFIVIESTHHHCIIAIQRCYEDFISLLTAVLGSLSDGLTPLETF